MSLFINDTDFGKKFTKIRDNLKLKGYGGNAQVHPDLIPFPDRTGEVLMVYTPEDPSYFEDMCLVRSNLNDMVEWSDDLWQNPVIKREDGIPWKNAHLADFCLLYVPELQQKWWTWYQPAGDMGCVIAVGTSQDGITWTDDYPQNPVLKDARASDSEFWYNRSPSVLWNRNTYKFEMFYDNIRPDWGAPQRLKRAESIDGFTWTNREIIYDPAEYGLTDNAFHPVVRYFDGHYWCWFPMTSGLYFMFSKTGLKGEWSTPVKVIDNTEHEVSQTCAPYRVGALIDDSYKLHMMVSHYDPVSTFKIDYWTSELSAIGKQQLKEQNYRVNDFDMGGSIIGGVLPLKINTPTGIETLSTLQVESSPMTVYLQGRKRGLKLVESDDVNASSIKVFVEGSIKNISKE